MGLALAPMTEAEGAMSKMDLISYFGHVEHKFCLQAVGDGEGSVLSHSNGEVSLMGSAGGLGEYFFLHFDHFPLFAEGPQDWTLWFACLGGELGKYLSHGGGNLSVAPNRLGGEKFSIDLSSI